MNFIHTEASDALTPSPSSFFLTSGIQKYHNYNYNYNKILIIVKTTETTIIILINF